MSAEDAGRLEHALYLALVGPIEAFMRMDPCPAMRLADEIARAAMKQVPDITEHLKHQERDLSE